MKSKRIYAFLICLPVFLLLFSGCRKIVPYETLAAASAPGEEIHLSDGAGVSLVLSPETNGQAVTAEHLVTNSKKISVSCSALPDDAEVLLVLYDESQVAPVSSTSLSARERSMTFQPLTSVKLYTVSVSVKNCSDEVSFTITD